MTRHKKTENCCRVCKHYGWGLTRRGQIYETRVCLEKPKIYKNVLDNIEPHFYVADPCGWCNKFEKGGSDEQ